MKHTDELYISHYNKDLGGDQGLFSKHYDGNMRFLSFGSVVRAESICNPTRPTRSCSVTARSSGRL